MGIGSLIDELDSFDIIKYIISATLSDFESGTWFYTEDGGLKEKLTELYIESKHSLIKKHLFGGISTPFNDSSRINEFSNDNYVRKNLGVNALYGKHIGLTNWGFDYNFQIDTREKYVKIRAKIVEESKGVLGEENFNFFKELGKKLKED